MCLDDPARFACLYFLLARCARQAALVERGCVVTSRCLDKSRRDPVAGSYVEEQLRQHTRSSASKFRDALYRDGSFFAGEEKPDTVEQQMTFKRKFSHLKDVPIRYECAQGCLPTSCKIHAYITHNLCVHFE